MKPTLTRWARRVAFAFPFGCLTALLSHAIRFGDEHAFGGDAHEAIVSVAIVGSIAIALWIAHAFLTAGSTTVTGTLAAARVRTLVPNATFLFALAAMLYYSIETLEGNGVELGWPTGVLALISIVIARCLKQWCCDIAQVVSAIGPAGVALPPVQPLAFYRRAPQLHLLRAQTLRSGRRFGRAPPKRQRFIATSQSL